MSECRGHLLQRVRRGLALDQDRAALEAHLGTCESCQLAVDIADDFDQVGVADPEDAERVARIAAVARRTYERRQAAATPPRASRLAWLLAAAALVVAGGAVAEGWRWHALRAGALEASTPVSPPPTAVGNQKAIARSSPVVDPSPSAEPDVSAPPSPPTQAKGARSMAAAPTAERLYRQANEARRSGQTEQAIGLYQRLQATFPGSAQARLSHVSLGRLLLQGGSAGAALRQFDAYLAGGSGQRLAAEAMFGRGQALQALGRTAEEVQNWRRLIGQYPDSAYATHASRRLEVLE